MAVAPVADSGSLQQSIAVVGESFPYSRIVDAFQRFAAVVAEDAQSVAAKRVVPLYEKLCQQGFKNLTVIQCFV